MDTKKPSWMGGQRQQFLSTLVLSLLPLPAPLHIADTREKEEKENKNGLCSQTCGGDETTVAKVVRELSSLSLGFG